MVPSRTGPKEAALGRQCQSCHGAYRDRSDDGTFFIKPESTR